MLFSTSSFRYSLFSFLLYFGNLFASIFHFLKQFCIQIFPTTKKYSAKRLKSVSQCALERQSPPPPIKQMASCYAEFCRNIFVFKSAYGNRTSGHVLQFVLAVLVIYRVYKKKLNKPEIAPRLCKAPQCAKFFIEIGVWVLIM